MADENEKLLMTLLKKSGNAYCADCHSKCKWFQMIIFSNKNSKHLFVQSFYRIQEINDENVLCLLE